MIVTLIGYRGCGKSSVGPLLAKRLGYDCVDSDDVIEQTAQKSIAAIFADDGEAAFRTLETEVLFDLLGKAPLVIAAGGGAILAEINRSRMQAAGPVIWLDASAVTLATRIAGDEKSGARRPSLTGRSIQEEVSDVLEARRPLYSDAATLTVDVERRSPEEVAENIFVKLNPKAAGEMP